ncbi:MAG: hypothetical protein LBF97_07590 [Elusimicrobiota bacterium]|jgi:hypothetical protein|nr:hypothetical protein [Elusimicrobiota bacterium]
MQIICENGYYKIWTDFSYEKKVFEESFGEIVLVKDYYTFSYLADLKDYSIGGLEYGNLVAKKNYAGTVEAVIEANGFVYSLQEKELVELEKVAINIDGYYAMDSYIGMTGVLQAGSKINGKRVKSYRSYVDCEGSGIISIQCIKYY